MPTIYL